MFSEIKNWDGETVLLHHIQEIDAWFILSIFSSKLGVPAGGTRLKVYDNPDNGLLDSLALSKSMAYKFALANINRGGGKCVISLSRPINQNEREQLFTSYGKWLAFLGNVIETAGDYGTTDQDLNIVSQNYNNVFGLPESKGGAGNLGIPTGWGVYYGIKASINHVFGSPDLSEKCIYVQGVGSVGKPLIKKLLEDGAIVKVSDVDINKLSEFKKNPQIKIVSPDNYFYEECDVFSPCALGGILTKEFAEATKAKIIAGAANNQLSSPEVSGLLANKGILYAPDFVINAGAIIWAYSIYDGLDQAASEQRVKNIENTLSNILKLAKQQNKTPIEIANNLAEEILKKKEKK